MLQPEFMDHNLIIKRYITNVSNDEVDGLKAFIMRELRVCIHVTKITCKSLIFSMAIIYDLIQLAKIVSSGFLWSK